MKIFFKTIKNKEFLYDIIIKILTAMNKSDVIKEYLMQNINKFPFELEMKEFKNLNKDFIYELYNFKFIWWEDKNLLGLIKENLPLDISKTYFKSYYDLDKHLFVSNNKSLFEFEDWKVLGKWFENVSYKFQTMSEFDFLKYQPYTDTFDKLILRKKEYLPKFIKDELDIDNILYNNTSSKFDIFKISLISDCNMQFKILNILNLIKIEHTKNYLNFLQNKTHNIKI